jgi:diguanylate cyclase (GGDEF)-like protein
MLVAYLEEKMSDLMRQQNDSAKRQPWLAYAYALALLLSVAEYLAPANFKLMPFYILPVGMAAIKCGRRDAYTLAIFCGLCIELADLMAGKQWVSLEMCWNAVLTGFFLALSAFFAGTLKALFDQRVKALRTDGLTGLPGLAAFEENLTQTVERCRRFGHPFSVAYVGCDNFGVIAGKYGAPATEGVMRLTSQCLRSSYRGTDVVARVDEDAFVVLLTETVGNSSVVAVEKLNARLEEIITRHYPDLTFSIGLVSFDQCPYSSREVLNMAEVACLQARSAAGKLTTANDGAA